MKAGILNKPMETGGTFEPPGYRGRAPTSVSGRGPVCRGQAQSDFLKYPNGFTTGALQNCLFVKYFRCRNFKILTCDEYASVLKFLRSQP